MAHSPTGPHYGTKTLKFFPEVAATTYRLGIVFDLLVEVLYCSSGVGAIRHLHGKMTQLLSNLEIPKGASGCWGFRGFEIFPI